MHALDSRAENAAHEGLVPNDVLVVNIFCGHSHSIHKEEGAKVGGECSVVKCGKSGLFYHLLNVMGSYHWLQIQAPVNYLAGIINKLYIILFDGRI